MARPPSSKGSLAACKRCHSAKSYKHINKKEHSNRKTIQILVAMIKMRSISHTNTDNKATLCGAFSVQDGGPRNREVTCRESPSQG